MTLSELAFQEFLEALERDGTVGQEFATALAVDLMSGRTELQEFKRMLAERTTNATD